MSNLCSFGRAKTTADSVDVLSLTQWSETTTQHYFIMSTCSDYILVPPLFIEGDSHSYNWSIFVFAGATVPY